MRKLVLTKNVLKRIVETLGNKVPECGGILGVDENGVVTDYYFDESGRSAPDCYIPDIDAINEVLAEEWFPKNIFMAGIVHSHSPGNKCPSCCDVNYGMNILKAINTVECFYIPIFTHNGQQAELHCFVVERDEKDELRCMPCDYDVVV